ncbi:MAG: hypothetical protein EAZ37_07950 [Burkholderiales bacterium]|nr:MAG: hypothetical protein EAZ37_07950 [Burkholderiales bacterium]
MRPLNPNDPNVAMLELVALRLGAELGERFTFVGGAVAGLLITDPANPAIRPTEDVDIVVEAVVLKEYHQVEKQLRARGFVQDMRPQAPICRWRMDGLTVDVMPSEEKVLGFANRWYPLGVRTAQALALPSGTSIRVLHAPVFIATKLEAFKDRGAGDYLFSHDFGDIASVVDGRESLLLECADVAPELKTYLSDSFAAMGQSRAFWDALPGHLPGDAISQERLPELEEKFRQLAQLKP